jgi:hypothetical protein
LTKIDLGAELCGYDGTQQQPDHLPAVFNLPEVEELLRGKPTCIGTLKDLQAEGFKPIPAFIQARIDLFHGGQP